MNELEFKIEAPTFPEEFTSYKFGPNGWLAWVEISLTKNDRPLHKLHFAVAFHSWMCIPFMEKLMQNYMSTTRGLNS